MNWQAIVILSVIVEGVITNLKFLWTKQEFSISRVASLITSILIAIITNANLFLLVDLPVSVPYIGSVLTGIIVSSGANFVYDLWDKLINIKKWEV